MQQHLNRFGSVLSLLLAVGCASGRRDGGGSGSNPFAGLPKTSVADWASAQKLSTLQIVFMSNTNGEVAQCGCAVNPKGGLDRKLNFVRSLGASKDRVILDAGNTLFSTESMRAPEIAAALMKAQTVLKGHKLIGVDVQNVGFLDLTAGSGALKDLSQKSGIKMISTNLASSVDGKLLFDSSFQRKLSNGVELVVFGLTRGPAGVMRPELKVLDPLPTLQKELARVSQNTTVVVLSDLGVSLDKELAEKLDRAVVFIGSRDLSSLEIPVQTTHTLEIQSSAQGQQMGVLDVAVRGGATGYWSSALTSRFADRWSDIEKGVQDDMATQARRDLQVYAPGDVSKKSLYDVRLVDLTVAFGKRNELSDVSKKK